MVDDFSEFKQTNQFVAAVSSITSIVDTYLANKMNEAVKTAMQLQSDRIRDEAQAENEDFINTLDENMRKIIKKQVKEQVKEQVSKILLKIEKFINDQLEAEVLTRSSNQAKTSHAIAANLSELELKKILIDKMENNKSIDRSIQRRAGKEPESTSVPKEKTSKSTDKYKEGSKSHYTSTGKFAQVEELMHADEDLEEPAHQEFDIGFTEDQPVDETTQHPDWFQKPTKPPTPDCRRVIPFDHFISNDLAYLSGGVSSRTYATSVTKTKAADYGHIKWIKDFVPNLMWIQVPSVYDKHELWGISYWGRKHQQFYGFAVKRESARDVYSRHIILAITKLTIVEWHNYKHLDWIIVRRDDEKLYTFKKGDYNRLRLQDIEDMLLLLIQGKLTNLNVEERLALGVSLRMFTRSIVLRRRVEDIQLGVKSYQKKLNLTRPDTYRSDLKRKTPYTTYSNPKGFIYQNKDKKNRLMRIDELHKFSDGTLNDVRSALDDILKRIQMEYLPQTVWRNVDRERAGVMIHAIDRQLRNKRLLRRLEKFVGGRLYGYIKNHKKTVKNGQARTRESEVYKKKPRIQNRSQKIIKNGNKVLRRTVGTVEQVYEPTTTEEKHDRRNEMKSRATLLMALPNKDQLKFYSYQEQKLFKIAKRKVWRKQESKKFRG
ncbi:hypothetical protein Tco_0526315 [Tanacetum coccineum]